MTQPMHDFLDFFAGSGLVGEGLKPFFRTVWANDICEKKARVYAANHPADCFVTGPIQKIKGNEIPKAVLSWASFPCQDLSLAGRQEGIRAERSGLFWQWLRVMDEMAVFPPVLVMENVSGLVSSGSGKNYRSVHESLVDRGFKVGPVLLNAKEWLPQSRPRVFVIAVRDNIDVSEFLSSKQGWAHPRSVQKAAAGLKKLVLWKLPKPREKKMVLHELVEFDAPCIRGEFAKTTLNLIKSDHIEKLKDAVKNGANVFPAYKRTRNGKQVLELRFDGIAGCLRTPSGGSSRQFLVIHRDGKLEARLLTVREAASLMGAPDYNLPENYNEGYRAMGDAVAVPVVRHLAEHLLKPLADAVNDRP